MSRASTYAKMALLSLEVEAAVLNGPARGVASLVEMEQQTVFFSLISLAREMLPEVSIHYSRRKGEGEILEYVIVRETEQALPGTAAALKKWLSTNSDAERVEPLGEALQVLRKAVSRLDDRHQKVANRHLRLITGELNFLLP